MHTKSICAGQGFKLNNNTINILAFPAAQEFFFNQIGLGNTLDSPRPHAPLYTYARFTHGFKGEIQSILYSINIAVIKYGATDGYNMRLVSADQKTQPTTD